MRRFGAAFLFVVGFVLSVIVGLPEQNGVESGPITLTNWLQFLPEGTVNYPAVLAWHVPIQRLERGDIAPVHVKHEQVHTHVVTQTPSASPSYVEPVQVQTTTTAVLQNAPYKGYIASSYFSCIAWVESRDTPTAYNSYSGASGLFGFMPVTWQNVTGLSPPASAYSAAVQLQAAEKLLSMEGTSPWAGDAC